MPDEKDIDYTKLNPQVVDVTIGIHSLRNIKIYPLSMASQLELSDLITQAVAAFLSMQEAESDQISLDFVSFMFNLIKENLSKIFGYIAPAEGDIFKEITNDQLAEIIEIVYKANFEGPAKKVMELFPKAEEEIGPQVDLQLRESLRQSVESTVTDRRTSSRRPIKKVG